MASANASHPCVLGDDVARPPAHDGIGDSADTPRAASPAARSPPRPGEARRRARRRPDVASSRRPVGASTTHSATSDGGSGTGVTSTRVAVEPHGVTGDATDRRHLVEDPGRHAPLACSAAWHSRASATGSELSAPIRQRDGDLERGARRQPDAGRQRRAHRALEALARSDLGDDSRDVSCPRRLDAGRLGDVERDDGRLRLGVARSRTTPADGSPSMVTPRSIAIGRHSPPVWSVWSPMMFTRPGARATTSDGSRRRRAPPSRPHEPDDGDDDQHEHDDLHDVEHRLDVLPVLAQRRSRRRSARCSRSPSRSRCTA